jgi:hypothetical protein
MTAKRKSTPKLKGYTWFPFDVVDWLTSDDVRRMTTAEEGLYIRLLAVQWRDGYLPSDLHILSKSVGRDKDLLGRWFRKWQHLFPISPANPNQMVNAKLHEIAVMKGKFVGGGDIEEKRIEENRQEEKRKEAATAAEIAVDLLNTFGIQKEPLVESRKNPDPELAPKPEKSSAEKLANHFWNRLGSLKRYSNPETVLSWTKQCASLLKSVEYETASAVMDWALGESAFWTERIVGATSVGPMEFFCDKYETIEQQMFANQKSLDAAKNKIRKTTVGIHAAQNPELHTGLTADGTSWVADKTNI